MLVCISISWTDCVDCIYNFIIDVHQMKINSLKTVFKILQYIWKHKYPERQSAFTY